VVRGSGQASYPATGIFRGIPHALFDPYQQITMLSAFQMLSATRDSAEETFRRRKLFQTELRIYLGRSQCDGSGLGVHVYTLTYAINRQLGFFSDHDELFERHRGWAGNFRIDHASAIVHFVVRDPCGTRWTLAGFTGPKGSRESKLNQLARHRFVPIRHDALTGPRKPKRIAELAQGLRHGLPPFFHKKPNISSGTIATRFFLGTGLPGFLLSSTI